MSLTKMEQCHFVKCILADYKTDKPAQDDYKE